MTYNPGEIASSYIAWDLGTSNQKGKDRPVLVVEEHSSFRGKFWVLPITGSNEVGNYRGFTYQIDPDINTNKLSKTSVILVGERELKTRSELKVGRWGHVTPEQLKDILVRYNLYYS